MESYYKKKYLKYKSKYINTQKNFKGGKDLVPIKAIAFFSNSEINGSVTFEEIFDLNDLVQVTVNLKGFVPNSIHGFHVHESGDLSEGCKTMCAHFNPTNKSHGGRDSVERHVGDLGNLEADSNGDVKFQFTDKLIKLRGEKSNIIGRGLIIHADQDDCGLGHSPDSKKTGNSGERIGCAIIGYASIDK